MCHLMLNLHQRWDHEMGASWGTGQKVISTPDSGCRHLSYAHKKTLVHPCITADVSHLGRGEAASTQRRFCVLLQWGRQTGTCGVISFSASQNDSRQKDKRETTTLWQKKVQNCKKWIIHLFFEIKNVHCDGMKDCSKMSLAKCQWCEPK